MFKSFNAYTTLKFVTKYCLHSTYIYSERSIYCIIYRKYICAKIFTKLVWMWEQQAVGLLLILTDFSGWFIFGCYSGMSFIFNFWLLVCIIENNIVNIYVFTIYSLRWYSNKILSCLISTSGPSIIFSFCFYNYHILYV